MSAKNGSKQSVNATAAKSIALQLPLPLSTDESDLSDGPDLSTQQDLPPVSVDDLDAMHRDLAQRLGEPLDLVGTENKRTLLSWKRGLDGLLRLRIHKQFSRAAEPTLNAVASYIRHGDKSAAAEIRNFARELGLLGKRPGRARYGAPLGMAHDLRCYLDDQNRQHFAGQFKGRIGWSRRTRSSKRKTIRLGSWSPRNKLIRIHPALDDRKVPEFVLRFVVFHEMLHAEIGASEQGARRIYHSRDFRRREQEHPDYAKAEAWIQSHLDLLLNW